MMKQFIRMAQNTLLTKTVLVHLCCWFLFIGYELGMVYFTTGSLESPFIFLIYYAQNILFFYVLVGILNFTFQRQNAPYLLGAILFIGLFIVYLITKFITEHFLSFSKLTFHEHFIFYWKFILNNLARGVYFTILATFYWAAGHIAYFKKQAADSERQQLLIEKDKAILENRLGATQNAYLKQQLNPHLLFNALNFIYSCVFKSSKRAAQSVLLLSDMMQYSLKETGSDGKIALSEELQQIKNLLEINRYRFDVPLSLTVRLSGEFERYRIIPLVLFTLTENMFKHGQIDNPHYPAVLAIEVTEDGQLTYSTYNLKKTSPVRTKDKSLGLKNVRIRLDYAYHGRYSLNVSEDDDFYELSLNLTL